MEDKIIIEKFVKFREQEAEDWGQKFLIDEQITIEDGTSDVNTGNVQTYSIVKKIYGKRLQGSLDKPSA